MMEVVVAMAVITILVTGVLVGEGAQLRAVKQSYDELAASRAAAGRLEELTAPGRPLREGSAEFDPGIPGHYGFQGVRRVTPGLWEVRVAVGRGERDEVRLTTLVARRRR